MLFFFLVTEFIHSFFLFCKGRKPVSSLPLQIHICIHSYVELFHSSVITIDVCFVSLRLRRPYFLPLFVPWAKQNQERRKGAFLSFQVFAYFPGKTSNFFFFCFFSLFFLKIGVPRTRESTVAFRTGLRTSTSGIFPSLFQTPSVGSFPRGYRFWTRGINPKD